MVFLCPDSARIYAVFCDKLRNLAAFCVKTCQALSYFTVVSYNVNTGRITAQAPIAQMDRVTVYETAGCPFESGWAHTQV